MRFLSKIAKQDLSREICILRVDFNVENWQDSLRIQASIPTIKCLLDRRARVIILSHRGRHKEADNIAPDPSLTLSACIPVLSRELSTAINFLEGFDFPDMREKISRALPGSVFLLENLRFHKGEEKNDAKFARELASLGTLYVNDAFAVSHRKNASIVGITKYMPSYAGLLFEKEVAVLSEIMRAKKHPLVVILGGGKTDDKLGVLKNLWRVADFFLLGGGPGNTALKAGGVNVGDSVHDARLAKTMKKTLIDKKVIVPVDWIFEENKILDIGLETIENFKKYIGRARMIIWNGPLGLFEDAKYAVGSNAVAEAIAQSRAFSVIGGGETTQLVLSLHLQNKFSHLSTGGGAMLEFLAGKKLPGIIALNK